jgi:hypothetical protein
MCIDYRKLMLATKKDHFPLSFIDEMIERLAKHSFFCFLDGYSGYHQIPIHLNNQSKTTFTCPYRRMSFGLCNAPASFQRCMISILSDMIEEIMLVFKDDFSIYRKTFDHCLKNLDNVLQRCLREGPGTKLENVPFCHTRFWKGTECISYVCQDQFHTYDRHYKCIPKTMS